VHAEVFAVEDTSVQVCWRDAAPGPVTVRAGDLAVVVESGGGSRGVVVSGLPAGTRVAVSVTAGRSTARLGHVTTLTPPPGAQLSKFATVNDLHLGASQFGTFRPIWNDDPADPHPRRCARAALAEARAWGAEAIAVKGDLTQQGRRSEWEEVGDVLLEAGLPLLVIEGNHETKTGAVDGTAILAGRGIALATVHATSIDLPGVRIVGLPTTGWHTGRGSIASVALGEAVDLAAAAPRGSGVVVALHHYPQRFRHPTIYPRGIPGDDARRALDTLAEANPRMLVLAGHSHRHRRHFYRSMVLAESGSTKDFPGSWAGFTVYEGGILQTTRRIMDPSVMAWTERGRRVLGGVWGVWAPGLRSHRCFSYAWGPA
jgi:3',5'-cyclic-AMP phosphodiesterase